MTKSKSSTSLFAWLLAALVIAFAIGLFTSPKVHADTVPAPATIELATHVLPNGSLLLAQVTPPATDAKPPVVASTPWYADGTVIASLIAFVTSITAIWSHKEKKTAQKVSESLVAGIEAATKIPAVADYEKRIKAQIKQSALDYGVQPVLDKIVQEITA